MSTFMATRRTSRESAAGTSSMPTGRCSAASRPWPRGCSRASTRPTYTPFIDTGDHVVVVNAAKVKLTGRKEDQKIYRQHSGYEGGLREERARIVRQRKPERLVEEAVHGMLPEDEAGRGDVPQAESVRRSGSPAHGAETHPSSRSRNVAAVEYYGTGRRKTSTARVFLRPGTGAISVNRRAFEAFFPTEALRTQIKQPLVLTETADKFDILATVAGGGVSGQAGAVRLGHRPRAGRVQRSSCASS